MADKKLTGVELIAEERRRQIEEEKWDAKHDQDSAGDCQLAAAAGCYVANYMNKHFENNKAGFHVYVPYSPINVSAAEAYGFKLTDNRRGWVDAWPWSPEWDKRNKHDKIRSLIIAGALIAAELDRVNGLWNQDGYSRDDLMKDIVNIHRQNLLFEGQGLRKIKVGLQPVLSFEEWKKQLAALYIRECGWLPAAAKNYTDNPNRIYLSKEYEEGFTPQQSFDKDIECRNKENQ